MRVTPMIVATLALAASGWIGSAPSAQALTFRVETGIKGVDLTCTQSCEVFDLALDPDGFRATPLGAGVDSGDFLSASYGGIDNSNSSSNRLSFVNTVLSTSFSGQSDSSDSVSGATAMRDYSGGDSGGWTSSSKYFLAWSGTDPRYLLIKNNSIDNIFTWTTTGTGSGLSGVDGFGVVPLPAGVWLLLSVIGGFGVLRRMKGRAAT